MSRNDAKNDLIALGIESPTDEQITNYLNRVQGESQKERTRADKYKADADKMAELQKQLDEINNANLTEVQKAQKDLEDAQKKIAQLEQAQALATARNSICEKFKITSEQASKIIKDDMSWDHDVLAQIISDKELASANAKEQEIAKNQGNPGGGKATDGSESKPLDVQNAESISFAKVDSNAQKAIDYYTK